MRFTRRGFLQGTGAALAAASLPATSRAGGTTSGHILVPALGRWSDPDLFALAEKGVDIAMSLGAEYADVRLTNIRQERQSLREMQENDEWFGIGLRVIKQGHWGFMSSAVWTASEVERLAQGAIKQAEAFSKYLKGNLTLTSPPTAVSRGEWAMPIKYDPFDVPKGEKMDFMFTMISEISEYDNYATPSIDYSAQRKIALFASSNNSQWKQTTYRNGLRIGLGYPMQRSIEAGMGLYDSNIRPMAGKGWEYIIETDIFSEIPQEVEEVRMKRFFTPIEINRYDAVLAPRVVASILGATIGGATELDRALGYEANSVGTSFLNSPLEMVGNYQIGSSKLTVTADRTLEGGLNTVKWDDEGVPAAPFTLINKGIVADFQTTRETATHLAPYYQKNNKPVASNGSASSESGLFITTQHTSNLRMHAGDEDLSFMDLVGQVKKGVAGVDIRHIDIDFNCLNATISCSTREIRNGKLGNYINNAAFMIRTPEFWKSMVALGGQTSQKTFGFTCTKGQPEQSNDFSVSAVPALFENVGVIDESAR